MGNSSSALLPASEVLEMIAKDEKVAEKPTPVTDLPSPSSEDLCSALALLGVHMGDVPEADARRCWTMVAHPDFWRHHYASHPQKKRVKAWLFVHGKFRSSASSVVQAAETMQASAAEGCAAQKTSAAAKGVETSFRTLLSKIEGHSEFEDTQLFRFFREQFPEMGETIRGLEADHSEKETEETALTKLKSFREEPAVAAASANDVAAEVVVALKSYAASLEGHLEREERVLVAKWLNLDPEEYAKYRTYLVGKYKLVY